MAWQLNKQTLHAKLHRLPQSVVRSASSQPPVINNHRLRDHASLRIFYLPGNCQPDSVVQSSGFYNHSHPKGIQPHLQHYLVSSDSLLSSTSSNGVSPGRPLLRAESPSYRTSTNSNRQKRERSQLPRRIEGPDNAHTEFRISLHRNPSRNSGSNDDPSDHFWISPVLSEVHERSATPSSTASTPQREAAPGLPEPRRGHGNAESWGRNLPTAPGSGIWSPPLSRTTWWSLSDCSLISDGSAPQPPTEYRKVDVGRWISETSRIVRDIPNSPPGSDQSDVIYLGEFNAQENPRPHQPAPISPKREPSSSNSGSAVKRRVRRGRARHLRSDRLVKR